MSWGAPAWASSTQRAATSATTSASACWSPVSGPGESRYRLSAPRCTVPARSGNPNTACAPAASTGGVKAGQVGLAHHLILLVGVQARALTQGVLQLLDQLADLISDTQR